MNQREITSRDNPAVKRYVQLASSRKARREQGLFVTESIKLTCEAFDAGCRLVELYATEDAFDRYDDLERMALGCDGFSRVSQPVADKMAQSVSPQGVFGVFRMLDNKIQTATINSGRKILILSSLQDPGNVGTILRTAAAMGMDRVILSSDCPDVYSPKVLRSTMGGVFKLPVSVAEDIGSVIDALRAAGTAVYAAALDKRAVSLRDVSFDGACAVVIGNEGSGTAPELIERCDQTLIIPMEKNSESLNAAMAAGIIMWEMAK